jgi:hypothetical protein
MSTLAANSPRVFESGHDGYIAALPMIDNDIIYDGAAVGESGATGYFRPLASGDTFAGFATGNADNTLLGHAAGAVSVNVKRKGRVKLAVTGASAVTNEGASVFATDDDTFTLTPSGTRVGKVAKWVVSTTCYVDFDAETPAIKETISFPVGLHASKVIFNMYVATQPVRVTSLKYTPDIAAGGALTGTVVKATGTATPASATTPMHTAGAIDYNAAAHTVQPLTLSATVANLALVAGERIGLVHSAALTAGSGTVTIELERL